MHSLAPPTPAGRLRLGLILILAAAAFGVLALLPTARARASSPAVTLPPTEQVESVLGATPVGTLPAGKLAETLSRLEGFEGLPVTRLREALERLISELSGEGATLEELLHGEGAAKLEAALDEILTPLGLKLDDLLGGEPRGRLEEALASTPVSEVLGKLLSGSAEPQALLEQVLHALSPERLQSLLGSALDGEQVSRTSIEQLAHELGTTVEALDAQFGKTAEQLPASAMALTVPLENGETLGVVDGAKGVTLGVIRNTSETLGATGGNGPGGSGGSNGANGSGGSNGTPGRTVTVTVTTPAPTGSVAGLKAGKLRVLSHKVKGAKATIVLEVPAAGKLALSGRGIHRISRETDQAERVTIHPALDKAGDASLRRHHRKLKVPVKVTFKQVGGPSSSATIALTYK